MQIIKTDKTYQIQTFCLLSGWTQMAALQIK